MTVCVFRRQLHPCIRQQVWAQTTSIRTRDEPSKFSMPHHIIFTIQASAHLISLKEYEMQNQAYIQELVKSLRGQKSIKVRVAWSCQPSSQEGSCYLLLQRKAFQQWASFASSPHPCPWNFF